MTNREQAMNSLLAGAVTARMHEYEDYLAGRITQIRMSCGVCKYIYSTYCKDCPFFASDVEQCNTKLRLKIAQTPTTSYTEFGYGCKSPSKRLVRARYKELLQLLEDNGWEYNYDR
jgi:hypothetical protein